MSDDRAPIDLEALDASVEKAQWFNLSDAISRDDLFDLIAECRRLRAKIARVEKAWCEFPHTDDSRFMNLMETALADTEEPPRGFRAVF